MRRVNILLFGSYHGNNKGDEAILQSIISNINSMPFDVSVSVSSWDPGYIKNTYGIDSFQVKPWYLPKILTKIVNSDVVVIGGGGLIFDFSNKKLLDFGFSQLPFWLLIAELSKKLKKKTGFFGIGIGPLETKLGKYFTKYVFNKMDFIVVRDERSYAILKELGINRSVQKTSDPTLCLFNKLSSNKDKKKLIYNTIGVSVCPIKNFFGKNIEKKYIEGIASLVNAVIDEYNFQVTFLPMNIRKDIKITKKVTKRIKRTDMIDIIESNLMPLQIIQIIKNFDFFIGTRLHSIIFSSIALTPFLAINYQDKVKEFIYDLKMEDCLIEVPSFVNNEKNILEIFSKKWEEKNHTQKKLEYYVPLISKNSCESFKILESILKEFFKNKKMKT